MDKDILYSDKLVEITSETLLFRTYYFPLGKKKIKWSQIESIEILEPTLSNGKYRIHGSGDFKTWFPRDGERPTRDTIFIINLHNTRRRIGFTVENSEKIVPIFRSKDVLLL